MGGDKMLYNWGVFKNTLVGGFIHNAVKTISHDFMQIEYNNIKRVNIKALSLLLSFIHNIFFLKNVDMVNLP